MSADGKDQFMLVSVALFCSGRCHGVHPGKALS